MPIAVIAVMTLLLAAPAVAQETRTYGTTSSVVYPLPASAFSFRPGLGGNHLSGDGGTRFCTGFPVCILEAPVQLPAGARVNRIELQACDSSSTTRIAATLHRVGENPGDPNGTEIVSTSISDTAAPGCIRVAGALTVGHTIDNVAYTYRVVVQMYNPQNVNADTRLTAVRLFYQLQVSPTPATATFNDVPTNHPFFPFIEALVRAGITSGCDDSPPMFCPDAHVTREQMAAFLARALGLHWAP